MSTGLKLRVVTPSGPVVDLVARAITACSEAGEFCVLPEHSPILAALKPGRFVVETDGEIKVYATDIGFFEGGADHVNVMTQHCVPKEAMVAELDELENELASLKETFSSLEDDSPARTTVQATLMWVETQLSVAKE